MSGAFHLQTGLTSRRFGGKSACDTSTEKLPYRPIGGPERQNRAHIGHLNPDKGPDGDPLTAPKSFGPRHASICCGELEVIISQLKYRRKRRARVFAYAIHPVDPFRRSGTIKRKASFDQRFPSVGLNMERLSRYCQHCPCRAVTVRWINKTVLFELYL